jgi:SNF2 family DNA or RNA helicase
VQIQAGGLGIDLTRSCYCFFYSLGSSLGDYEQAKSRLHRQGQTRNVTYYHILALCDGQKTADHKVYRALDRKENVAQAVLNIGKE